MSGSAKPSIVFCHGIWADGSCFSKVIPPLQAAGYEVMSAQYGLGTNVGDVAAVKRTLDRVKNPAILVGHSYGGAVIRACIQPPATRSRYQHIGAEALMRSSQRIGFRSSTGSPNLGS
jgi:hypothetical protein